MATILIIEDNTEIRENITEILQLAKYDVIEAENGKKGILLAETHNPDLILCDLTIPILDGYGVLQLLNARKLPHQIPFIILTARSERNDIRKGMDLGADDYIIKPFDPGELLTSIECQLNKNKIHPIIHKEKILTTEEIISLLVKDRNIHKYKNKQTIYEESKRPAALYFIITGKVKSFKSNDDGKELITGLYNEGDFLGYCSLLGHEQYKDSAASMEVTEIAVIPADDFYTILNTYPQLTQQFIWLLAKDIKEKEIQLLGIAYNSLRKKTAEALLAMYKKFNPDGDHLIPISISRINMAAVAGVAKESFIRTLGDFEKEKLIEMKGSDLFLLAPEKLTRIIN